MGQQESKLKSACRTSPGRNSPQNESPKTESDKKEEKAAHQWRRTERCGRRWGRPLSVGQCPTVVGQNRLFIIKLDLCITIKNCNYTILLIKLIR